MNHKINRCHERLSPLFVFAVAAVATQMNCELNGVEPLVCLTKNMIGRRTEAFDLILLGDMFYDEALASSLHSWLDLCIRSHGTKVLIGDPGRASFEEHGIRRSLRCQAQYELPASVREENYGLTCSTVWSYCPEPWAMFVMFFVEGLWLFKKEKGIKRNVYL